MSVLGIVVNLEMGDNGTDDHIYIGVHGTRGGREFPLNVAGFDDFEKHSNITYAFGSVWEGWAIEGAAVQHPIHSEGVGINAPHRHSIWLESVNTVYIRKAAITTKNDDDKCKIKRVVVTLYGTRPKMRIFKGAVMWAQQAEGEFVSDLILSNETGLQCWLHEVEEEAIEKRLPEEKG